LASAVANRESNLPAQRYDAADEIGAEDVPFPRMKFAQKQTDEVDAELVEYGSIFTRIGQGDAEPTTISKPTGKEMGTQSSPAVRFYVLGIRTGYSWRDENDQFQRSQFPPDNLTVAKVQAAGNRVDKTYDYTIAIPGLDTEMPYRFLLTGAWGGPAARLLNLMLKRAAQQGPSSEAAFEVVAEKGKNAKGMFSKAVVTRAKVPAREAKKDLEVVRKLTDLVRGRGSAAPEEVVDAEVVDAPAV